MLSGRFHVLNVTFGSRTGSGSALSGLLMHLRFWQLCVCLLAFVVRWKLERFSALSVVCQTCSGSGVCGVACVVWRAVVCWAGLTPWGGWECLLGLTGVPHRLLEKKLFILLC